MMIRAISGPGTVCCFLESSNEMASDTSSGGVIYRDVYHYDSRQGGHRMVCFLKGNGAKQKGKLVLVSLRQVVRKQQYPSGKGVRKILKRHL